MKSINKKKIIKYMLVALFFMLFIGSNVVYAATSAKIAFCDYRGVRRAFKMLGILLNMIKIIVPLIIILSSMASFFGIILSGKIEDLKTKTMQLIKNVVAGLIIFFLPSVINFTIESLVNHPEDATFMACTTCMLDTDHCVIPDSDPVTYEED